MINVGGARRLVTMAKSHDIEIAQLKAALTRERARSRSLRQKKKNLDVKLSGILSACGTQHIVEPESDPDGEDTPTSPVRVQVYSTPPTIDDFA